MVKNLQITDTGKLVNKKNIHNLVKSLKKELHFDISSLIINFISAGQILEINKRYLNHDNTTDIITFNYSGDNLILDGEIFISVEDTVKNSKKFKVSFVNEVNRLIIHGILHLLGYEDKKKSDKLVMKRLENKLVKKYSDTNYNKK